MGCMRIETEAVTSWKGIFNELSDPVLLQEHILRKMLIFVENKYHHWAMEAHTLVVNSFFSTLVHGCHVDSLEDVTKCVFYKLFSLPLFVPPSLPLFLLPFPSFICPTFVPFFSYFLLFPYIIYFGRQLKYDTEICNLSFNIYRIKSLFFSHCIL